MDHRRPSARIGVLLVAAALFLASSAPASASASRSRAQACVSRTKVTPRHDLPVKVRHVNVGDTLVGKGALWTRLELNLAYLTGGGWAAVKQPWFRLENGAPTITAAPARWLPWNVQRRRSARRVVPAVPEHEYRTRIHAVDSDVLDGRVLAHHRNDGNQHGRAVRAHRQHDAPSARRLRRTSRRNDGEAARRHHC